MEWLDSLNKSQLRSILRDLSEEDPHVSAVVRPYIQAPPTITHDDFLSTAEDSLLPSSSLPYLNKAKAVRWLDRLERVPLHNAVICLQALSDAVCISIKNGVRPSADILFSLFDSWQTHILSKASYLTDEEKKQIPTNLIRYHTFIGSIEYEPEEMEEESEDEEEPQEPNETEEDSEENFRTLAKSLVLQLDETLPDIPPPPAILQSPQISQHISQLLDKSSSKTSSSKPVGKTPVKRTNSPGHPTCAKKPETRRPPSPGKTATSKASAKAAPTLRATPKTNSKI